MPEQLTLSKEAFANLKDYLSKIAPKGGNWDSFLDAIKNGTQAAEANPEGYTNALDAKNTLKELTGKFERIAESLGVDISKRVLRDFAKKFMSVLKEEEEPKEKKETPEVSPQPETPEETEEKQEEEQGEEQEEEQEEENEENQVTSGISPDDSNELLMMIDELKEKIKSLELQNTSLQKEKDELNDEIPEVVGAVIDSALPEIIDIAKKQILNGNSDIKMKLEMFDKIAAIFDKEDLVNQLSEAISIKNFLSNYMRVKQFNTSQKIKRVKLSKKIREGRIPLKHARKHLLIRKDSSVKSISENRKTKIKKLSERIKKFRDTKKEIKKVEPKVVKVHQAKKSIKERLQAIKEARLREERLERTDNTKKSITEMDRKSISRRILSKMRNTKNIRESIAKKRLHTIDEKKYSKMKNIPSREMVDKQLNENIEVSSDKLNKLNNLLDD